tara:strand:+ start:2209 stop:2355 length:147 start_codon:yes stop_codon:yes gene_type:complete
MVINYTSILSERRDLNPRPPLPQSGALPNCATSRIFKLSQGLARILII